MTIFDYNLFRIVVAPEYADESDDTLDLFSAESALEVSETVWGKFHPRAWCLMTAHLLKMRDISVNGQSSTAQNQIKKTKVGDLEREYAVPENKKTDSLSLTIYGQELKRLSKKVLTTPLFVSC